MFGRKTTWTNWSGAVRCTPQQIVRPGSIDALIGVVRETAAREGRLRVVGSGHSFSPVAATDSTMVSLQHLRGISELDREGRSATILAGTPINLLGDMLAEHGLALTNQGDIDAQAIAGAVSTGTHGTGADQHRFWAVRHAASPIIASFERAGYIIGRLQRVIFYAEGINSVGIERLIKRQITVVGAGPRPEKHEDAAPERGCSR